ESVNRGWLRRLRLPRPRISNRKLWLFVARCALEEADFRPLAGERFRRLGVLLERHAAGLARASELRAARAAVMWGKDRPNWIERWNEPHWSEWDAGWDPVTFSCPRRAAFDLT